MARLNVAGLITVRLQVRVLPEPKAATPCSVRELRLGKPRFALATPEPNVPATSAIDPFPISQLAQPN